jgi:ribonuclease-3
MKIDDDLNVSPEILERFQNKISINFENKSLLIEALLHGSIFSGDKLKLNSFTQKNNLENANYNKLEHLGDLVLSLIIGDYFYHHKGIEEYAQTNKLSIESALTRVKIVLVKNENLVPVAHKLNLGKYIIYENLTNVEDVYADVIEAIIGAIYLDKGLPESKEFIDTYFDIEGALDKVSYSNPKGRVKEMCDDTKKTFDYDPIKEEGPDHNKKFTVALKIDGITKSTGEGFSKQKAEIDAATKYLQSLN